jgi:beta-carotene 3-hydroxylase
MIRALVLLLVSFAAMECVAYLAHRYVYHGFLWIFHKSHHSPRSGFFEWNDVFPVFFASVSIGVFWYAAGPPLHPDIIAIALGITIYGLIYSFFHDVYIHGRTGGVAFRSSYLQRMKKAHMVHHATGGEPYGLLYFRLKENPDPVNHSTRIDTR